MMDAPTVLAFDTSAAHCAAALLCAGRIVVERHEEMGRGQAERLMPLLQGVLAEAGLVWDALDGIGVGIGPGNFTGIRIAVAAARGLALGLSVPAIGVSGFEAMAEGAAGPVLVALPGPRGTVYLQPLADGTALAPPRQAAPEDMADALPPGARLIGPGGFDGIAPRIARIAAARLGQNLPRPAPLYLRPADAAPPADPPPVILP
ncbi:tRNA (adenosine(37)-N6)-threonylcarbamoyltransferase complex dimerization subunit type 1 TsaB [Rhodovulum steppense]|nr:tRNA (adenosine(37)-N6)-threonylcarbamoyltransferase complex dimerization subunit type 1 TsaB [Rhodovulum steppense]